MLLSKTTKVKWHGRNKKWYELKGYQFTKLGDEFEVKVEDLTHGGKSLVEVKCDCENCKNPYLKPIQWYVYLQCVKEDGKYFCNKCATEIFAKNKSNRTKLSKGKSFEQWCLENNRQDALDRWDYELNNCEPNKILYGTNKKYYFKCPRGIHNSELKNISSFTSGQEGSVYCNQCNSFAQWGIDNLGENFLEKYWDYDKNKVSPWEISCGSSSEKIWVKCQEKDYHGSYKITCNDFSHNHRCSYCSMQKVHPLDSLGKILEDKKLLNLWSDKNKKSPYEFSPWSTRKAWWKCPDSKHEGFHREIASSHEKEFRCPECQFSKGEKRIEDYLLNNDYIKGNDYVSQKEFIDLVGVGNKNLSYDFYLPKHNLLIEYQGEFHDGNGNYYINKNLKKQQEHDRRKKQYAIDNNIKLLEIWYWHFDNIEKILDKELNINKFKEAMGL